MATKNSNLAQGRKGAFKKGRSVILAGLVAAGVNMASHKGGRDGM